MYTSPGVINVKFSCVTVHENLTFITPGRCSYSCTLRLVPCTYLATAGTEVVRRILETAGGSQPVMGAENFISNYFTGLSEISIHPVGWV